jgi:hypothetical protein
MGVMKISGKRCKKQHGNEAYFMIDAAGQPYFMMHHRPVVRANKRFFNQLAMVFVGAAKTNIEYAGQRCLGIT